MDCPNWPPPLPSLPPFPPCRPPTPPPPPPPPRPVQEVKVVESQTQAWWKDYLEKHVASSDAAKTGNYFELTRRQRRIMLPMRTPTKQDKLIWSVPLPEGSYPPDGLPIWERLYLDRKLPMLSCPPNALVFARQQIGKKLWKDTEGQEFILYDPNSYEVSFSYENVHDPNLTTYYEGKEIRGFLVRLGNATADGWGLCSLQKFNQYRRYLKRVHLSLVHTEMARQEALKDEIHKMNEHRHTTKVTMDALQRKVMMEEVRSAITEALRQYRVNRINRILAGLKEKEERVRRLQTRRENEREMRRQKGLRLLAEQELKNKIATEIKRRKKIATLRNWHDTEQRTMKLLKKQVDERLRQRAEKVRIRWENKIKNLRIMFEKQDEYLQLQSEVKQRNIEIRNVHIERLKLKERDRFNEIREEGLRKKALLLRQKEDNRMEQAITAAWLRVNPNDYDVGTEIYRVKKSINSTMAELRTTQMEGPDRLSIIYMCRNRIQREQNIPFQVSFAIDVVLETTIQQWANFRLLLILETVITSAIEDGRKSLADIKAKYKEVGPQITGQFKAGDPYGQIYKPDPPREKRMLKKSPRKCFKIGKRKKSIGKNEKCCDEKENEGSEKEKSENPNVEESEEQPEKESKVATTFLSSYVHFGPVITREYELEFGAKMKKIADRPKTPMPSQEILCEAGFSEEKLNEVLPTLSEEGAMNLKEKRKFRKIFKKVALQLFKRSVDITKVAYEPMTRIPAVNKLCHLGDTDRTSVANTLCTLIMNHHEKTIYEMEEFEWAAKVVAREAIKEILNPLVFKKEQDDSVARTKIMFYVPKSRHKKPN